MLACRVMAPGRSTSRSRTHSWRLWLPVAPAQHRNHLSKLRNHWHTLSWRICITMCHSTTIKRVKTLYTAGMPNAHMRKGARLQVPKGIQVMRAAHHGDDQAPRAPDLILTCAVLHMLPQEPCILLMQAHGLLHHEGLACAFNDSIRCICYARSHASKQTHVGIIGVAWAILTFAYGIACLAPTIHAERPILQTGVCQAQTTSQQAQCFGSSEAG